MSSRSSRSDDHAPVITGLGVVSAIAVGAEEYWRAVLEGRLGARPIRSFDVSAMRNQIGCEIDDSQLPPSVAGVPRATRLGAAAAAEALADAGLEPEDVGAVCAGTTMGDLPEVEDRLTDTARPETSARVAPLMNGNFAGRIAERAGVAAPGITVATSCSAGNISIFRAADLVHSRQATAVLAGGADAFSRLAFIGFSRMRAMATDRCSPFAHRRQGMMLGEGAGFVVVEPAAAARARGAHVYAEIAGYGLSCDAYHIAAPAPDGRGAAAAMRLALTDAGLMPEDVDYISAHGTGTQNNDLAESRACHEVFGEHRPYISSLKALVGHCLGAASALEAVASVLSLRDQRVIPAWNVEQQDERCDVRLPLPGEVDGHQRLRVVISNGFAFGGNNSCLVLRAA